MGGLPLFLMMSKSKKKVHDIFEKLTFVWYSLLNKTYCFQPGSHALECNLEHVKYNHFCFLNSIATPFILKPQKRCREYIYLYRIYRHEY